MAPTVEADEVVQVDTGAYRSHPPERWDVVLFTPPPHATPAATNAEELGIWIFRVVGLPGDMVSFDANGLLINGVPPPSRPPLIEGVQYQETIASGQPKRDYPIRVPEDHYFVLGDNPQHAHDSRFWGMLPRENILGRVKGK